MPNLHIRDRQTKLHIFCYVIVARGSALAHLVKIIHCYDDELALALSSGKRSKYIQPPLLERLGACDRRQWIGWEVRDFGV